MEETLVILRSGHLNRARDGTSLSASWSDLGWVLAGVWQDQEGEHESDRKGQHGVGKTIAESPRV